MTAGGSPKQVATAEFNVGLCLKRLGDIEDGMTFLHRALSDRSAEVGGKAAAMLGTIYKKRKAFAEALQYFERAHELGFPGADVGIAAVREDVRQAAVNAKPNDAGAQ